ncbi:GtrA family protein [Microbacterium sp. cx-55]|uniref:GtrA family protein n=1 Tax=Microbacterium sp. cx-55 TaxID=2875948 RepID=UPI001CC0094E|nr:GtrA family protein [Microbacterium sp. cx-55]MBZ4487094.1 GtrA family protein [Microbacterium sp. cx-55]UGB36007.1 GtrA family protein [Microbacterium sp. cx-55]
MRTFLSTVAARPEVRYLFFGGINTAFSYGLYSVFLITLHHFEVPGDFAIATALSWLISNVTSFALQRRFVFRSSARIVREFVRFSSVTLGSFAANLALGLFAVTVLGLNGQGEKLLSQLVITVILVIATFALHKAFSFRGDRVDAFGTGAVIEESPTEDAPHHRSSARSSDER